MATDPDSNFEVENPEIKTLLQDLGDRLKSRMPDGWGFSLLLFSYGVDRAGGGVFYVSSAERYDVVRAFREFLQHQGIEAGTDATAADVIGLLVKHATTDHPSSDAHDAAWGPVLDEAMNYLVRAKREHPDSAPEFWKKMTDEGLVT